MFDFVRTHNRLMQVALGVVLLPLFAASGVQGYTHFFSEAAESVASVDGQDISRTEWNSRHQQSIQRMRAQNPTVDLKQLDTPEARRQTLENLMRDRVLIAAEVHESLEPSDERVALAIRGDPQLQALRDPVQRAAFLAQRGLTADGLFDGVKDQLARNQALAGVTGSELVPAGTSKVWLDAWFDQREIQWQRFDLKDYATAIQPTDAEVQAYYNDKSHAHELTTPDEAKIQYVVFDVEALKPQMSINDADVRAYYQNNQSHYGVLEERRASHILVAVDPKATPADVTKARARADELLAQVRKNPGSFADVAKASSDDVGSKGQGGDLDFMSRKNAPAGGFADALFAMKTGDISDVVRSSAGFHIIQMTGVRGGTVRPFEEVKPQIEDLLRTQLAQKVYAEKADQFTNTVYEQADALPAKVDTYTLAPQTAVVRRAPQPGAAGPLASARLLGEVFANDALKAHHNTEAVETGTGQLTAARVLEYHPEHLRTLAEVHDQIVAKLRQVQATAVAQKDGQARADAARKDPSLALPLTATVGRSGQNPQVPRAVIEAALKADLSKGPVVTGLGLDDGGYAVVRVVKDVPRKADEMQDAQFKNAAEQAYTDAEQIAVYDALKARFKAEINEKRVARGEDASASAPN